MCCDAGIDYAARQFFRYELEDIDGESDQAKADRYWKYNIDRNCSLVGDLLLGS